MNKRILTIITIFIIALIIGAVMMMKTPTAETTAETASDSIIVPEQSLEETKDKEIVAAPKDEEDAIMDIGSLPTIDDMKELSEEEVHHTPESLLESAREIGNMIENAEKHPELREKTVKFLLECSEADNVVASIRAVCWKNTMNGVTNWKVFVPVTTAKVPDNIKDLANQLP